MENKYGSGFGEKDKGESADYPYQDTLCIIGRKMKHLGNEPASRSKSNSSKKEEKFR